ncbi:MAG: DUF1800 domain-containing protein [Actinomycetota bacterium]
MADPADIAHLLRRTEFVARQARVTELEAGTIAAAVTNVMDFTANANPQIPANLVTHDSANSYGQFIAAHNWWLDSMATRPRPFQEKMTLFWHGHFVSEWEVVSRTDHMMSQNQLFRTSGLGNFLALTHAMALQPAMLIYLSNGVNVKGTPNQNFARELLELFTLGVGNYAEDDVAEAARAWTGHNYNTTTKAYEFRPTRHDTGDKTFFGITRNWDGPETINEILSVNTAKQLIAAKLIAKKLWEFLAYPKPAAYIVDELAALFVLNNLEIRPLVEAILNRPEFYSAEAKQGLVRTPAEWVVNLLARTGLTSAAINVQGYSEAMGQMVFNPPNVAGWKNNSYWMTTSALSGRANLAKRVAGLLRANGGFDGLYAMSVADSVDYVVNYFGLAPLAASSRTALINAHQAERGASNGSNSRAVTNLLIMTMLTGEMNVPS